jgi:hypothetical protein
MHGCGANAATTPTPIELHREQHVRRLRAPIRHPRIVFRALVTRIVEINIAATAPGAGEAHKAAAFAQQRRNAIHEDEAPDVVGAQLRYFATKQLDKGALDALVGPEAKQQASGARVEIALTTLARNAEKHGDIKLDVPPMDILRAVVGLSAYASPGWEKNATKMIDILLAGIAKD